MPEQRRVVASYVPVFCKPEMLHLYRQISGLRNWRAHVITGKHEYPRTFHLHKRWITVLPKFRWRFFRRLWFTQLRRVPWQLSRSEVRQLLYAVQTHDARVVHIYFGHMALHMLPFIEASPWPVVVSFHGADAGVDMDRRTHRGLMERVFARADRILGRSEALLSDLRDLGCPPEKLRLNRTGIPLEEFPWSPPVEPGNEHWVFFQAGRLIEKKGYADSLRAFAEIRRELPKAVFRIAGEGPLREDLQRQAEALGIGNAVEWLGFLRQKPLANEFERAHVFLHPSVTAADGNREGVPNALLEAMAAGVPVIATRHGGIPEAIEDGKSGVLVDEGDFSAIAAAAMDLTANASRRQALSRHARKVVEEKFSHPAGIAALEAVYDEILPPYRRA